MRQLWLPASYYSYSYRPLFYHRRWFLLFFSAPNLRCRLIDRHQILPRSMVTQIYEIRSEIWGPLPPEIRRPKISKNIKFRRDFWQLHDLMANISGTQQDIVNRKTALQTTDTPRTGKRNLVYFRPQTAKNGTGVLTHPPAIVQMTGVNSSVAFARWQQQATIKLDNATHTSFFSLCKGLNSPSITHCSCTYFNATQCQHDDATDQQLTRWPL